MKNILLTLLVFGIVGCAMEEDTRLICDCDYTVVAENELICFGEIHAYSKSLVFNESKKKFTWDGFNLRDGGILIFEDDKITFQYQDENQQIYKLFDRVNLRFKESNQSFEKKVQGTNFYKNPKTIHYQCRVVEGV